MNADEFWWLIGASRRAGPSRSLTGAELAIVVAAQARSPTMEPRLSWEYGDVDDGDGQPLGWWVSGSET